MPLDILVNNAGITPTLSAGEVAEILNLEAPGGLVREPRGAGGQGRGPHRQSAAIAGRIGLPEVWCGSNKAGTEIMAWFVYMVRCADGTFYTGIATDVGRRLAEHNGNNRLAARYTRGRRPVTLAYTEAVGTRGAAVRRERAIKQLARQDKERLAAAWRLA